MAAIVVYTIFNFFFMLKKILALVIASLTILTLTVFSLTSVLAQDGSSTPAPQDPMCNNSPAPAPLSSSPRNLCREARKNYAAEVRAAKAKGLSQNLSRADIKNWIQSIKDLRNQICAEARALTSPQDVCKAAKKNYFAQVRGIKAKGLSLHLSRQEIKQMIKDIRDYTNQVCADARNRNGPRPSPST